MDVTHINRQIISMIRYYRVHIFVFCLTLFIGLTLTSPSILLNDEFITTNQLYQLHGEHQVIINEGKFGLGENGSLSGYFAYKSNILGYPLFFPLISLPAYWMIDITGEHFVFLILYLWTILSLILILLINHFFSEYSYIGRWQWTPVATVAVFAIFFINLFFYAVFPVDTFNTFPEVIAIVFTNCILLAITAVLVYEINHSIFEDSRYSFFGTLVCLFSSSYFFWMTHCKDHILVLPIFAAIFLCLIRFVKTDEYWYLPLTFILTGLLAWVRPELALGLCLLGGSFCGFTLFQYVKQKKSLNDVISILFSPAFTVIGALPFFLNNYLFTKNPFLPVQSFFLTEGNVSLVGNVSQPVMRAEGIKSVSAVILKFFPTVPSAPSDFLSDFTGIFFLPQNGSVSIFALVPLFLAMAVLVIILLSYKKVQFTTQEKKYFVTSLLVSAAVFLTYASLIHLLNSDFGIVPDIRYLSPLYIPLTIIGLIALKKVNILPENPVDSVKGILLICGLGLIFSCLFLPILYASAAITQKGTIPIGQFFSIYAIIIVIISLCVIFWYICTKRGQPMVHYMILLLCSAPFVWQTSVIFYYRAVSGFSGYTFWIPVIRVIWELIVKLIFFKSITP